MSPKPVATEKDIAVSLINTCRFLARSFLQRNSPARAMEVAEAMRTAADEITDEINATVRARLKP